MAASGEAKPIYSLLSLADLVTVLNLLLGFSAAIALLNGDLLAAGLLVLVAAVGDGADGLLARRAEQSLFGEALDSFADLVAFGVAPALVLYIVLAPWPPAGAALGGGFLACGALRLARFHLRGPSRESFQGLPITAGGFATFLLLLASPVGIPAWVFAPCGALLAYLMVSNLRYPKLRGGVLIPVGAVSAALLLSQLVFPPARPWTALALLGMMSVYLAAPLLQRKPLEPGPREAP